MTEQLEEAGYQTLPADDYSPEQDPSRIWYRPSFSAEANELLVFIPDARVEPLADPDLQPGADIVMVLGTGYEEWPTGPETVKPASQESGSSP